MSVHWLRRETSLHPDEDTAHVAEGDLVWDSVQRPSETERPCARGAGTAGPQRPASAATVLPASRPGPGGSSGQSTRGQGQRCLSAAAWGPGSAEGGRVPRKVNNARSNGPGRLLGIHLGPWPQRQHVSFCFHGQPGTRPASASLGGGPRAPLLVCSVISVIGVCLGRGGKCPFAWWLGALNGLVSPRCRPRAQGLLLPPLGFEARPSG